MDNLNTIPNSGTFGGAVQRMNANFQLIVTAINNLEYRTTRSKGVFDSLASLQAAGSAKVGDWGLVLGTGGTFPATIYNYNGTTWASGGTWSPGEVNLSQYATTAAMNAAIAEAVAAVEVETVDNLETQTTGKALDAHQGFVLAGQIEDTENTIKGALRNNLPVTGTGVSMSAAFGSYKQFTKQKIENGEVISQSSATWVMYGSGRLLHKGDIIHYEGISSEERTRIFAFILHDPTSLSTLVGEGIVGVKTYRGVGTCSVDIVVPCDGAYFVTSYYDDYWTTTSYTLYEAGGLMENIGKLFSDSEELRAGQSYGSSLLSSSTYLDTHSLSIGSNISSATSKSSTSHKRGRIAVRKGDVVRLYGYIEPADATYIRLYIVTDINGVIKAWNKAATPFDTTEMPKVMTIEEDGWIYLHNHNDYLSKFKVEVLSAHDAAAMTSPWSNVKGKEFVVLGDSTSDDSRTCWTQELESYAFWHGFAVLAGAVYGASWNVISNKRSVQQQWDNLKSSLTTDSPIIIITAGPNDWDGLLIGYDAALSKCATDTTGLSDNAEKAIQTLKNIFDEYPKAILYLVSNFHSRPNQRLLADRLKYREFLEALCDYFSASLIDLTRNSQIKTYIDVDTNADGYHIFTTDDTHAYTDAGRRRVARVLISSILRDFMIFEPD